MLFESRVCLHLLDLDGFEKVFYVHGFLYKKGQVLFAEIPLKCA